MLTIYHYPICPFSRFIRVLCNELDIEYRLEKVDFWRKSNELSFLTHAADLPIIVDATGHVLSCIYAMVEHLLELHKNAYIVPHSIDGKYEMRRVMYLCCNKLYQDVTKPILQERFLNLVTGGGSPRSDILRIAHANFNYHVNYFNNLLNMHGGYIAGDKLSTADLALASQISVIDYFGDINWDSQPLFKEWYCLIKSRPSFRSIRNDILPSIKPHVHYSSLDF